MSQNCKRKTIILSQNCKPKMAKMSQNCKDCCPGNANNFYERLKKHKESRMSLC